LIDALNEIATPAIEEVFEEGEVSAITVKLDPELGEGWITLSLTAVGEDFYDYMVHGDVDGCGVADWRERLRSNLADWVAESRFGWGQNRGV
jgi:hypothetical protein